MENPNTPIHILQFGTGNFLRGFFEPIIQRYSYYNKPLNICIIQSTNGNTLEKLERQNFQYFLYEAGIKNGEKIQNTQKITCIQSGISLPVDQDKFFEFAGNPEVKWIISNVTEAGLVWKTEDKFEQFAESFAGRICQWLYVRFTKLPDSETILLPCELLPKNGDLLKEFVLKHADHWGLTKDFSEWINQKVHFFNNLVDRIVPGYPSNLDSIQLDGDQLTVQVEPYSFWAIESQKPNFHLLPFVENNSGITIASEIDSFSLRKIRILNGCHTWMTAKSIYLNLHDTVSEFIGNPNLRMEVIDLLDQEIIPTLPFDKEETIAYSREILDRFANPFMAHKFYDISLNAFSKFKSRLLPIIQFHLNNSGLIPQKTAKGLLYLLLTYIEKPEKIRDQEDIKSYFSLLPIGNSIQEKLSQVLSEQFNLTWDKTWKKIVEDIQSEIN